MSTKQAIRPEPGPDATEDPPASTLVMAIPAARVVNLLNATGEPHQVVLENRLDPLEVIEDARYWQALPAKMFPMGARLELTNDAGSYLYEIWVRQVFGTNATGLRGIKFHHRVVWDERSERDAVEFEATGRWEVRFEGRHKLWRVYRPNGVQVETPFNDESSAVGYARQQEGNPRPL